MPRHPYRFSITTIIDMERSVLRTQRIGLNAVRLVGRGVAIVAAAIGIGFAVLAALGPSVWVFANDGSGAGQLIALPLALRLVRASAALFACLTVAVAAMLLVELAGHARDVRFAPALTRTTIALAVTIGAGTWLTQIAAQIAQWSMVIYPDGTDPAGADIADLSIEWAPFAQAIQPNWAMLGVAIILGVLAYIIRAGERLQRDTEGLV